MRNAFFTLRVKPAYDPEFGYTDYTIYELITETADGVEIDSFVKGFCDGEIIPAARSKKTTTRHPGVSFDNACNYRRAHDYHEIMED